MQLKSEQLMRSDEPLHYEMLKGLAEGWLQVLYDSENACLAYAEDDDSVYLTATTEEEFHAAMAVLDHVPDMMTIHQSFYMDTLLQNYGMSIDVTCYQVVRYTADLLPVDLPDNMEIRPITPDMYDRVLRLYDHGMNDYQYMCIRRGTFIGAFIDGDLAGFIGVHGRGAMGFLLILPQYRRHGLGYILEASLINRITNQGGTPFAQIVEDNVASLGLQQKLGMVRSEGKLTYLFKS